MMRDNEQIHSLKKSIFAGVHAFIMFMHRRESNKNVVKEIFASIHLKARTRYNYLGNINCMLIHAMLLFT